MSLVDLGKKLLECAKQGETEEVRALMTNGAPFTTDWLGTSPLHMAAQYGHVSTAEVLLRAGISRDARTKVDRTPLHVASQEGHLNIVELLIKHGAEIDARDMLKMTPLHWAVERGHRHIVFVLLKHNAEIGAMSKFHKTPLDIAEDNDHKDMIQMLVEHTVAPHRTKVYQQKQKTVQLNENSQDSLSQTIKSLPLIIRSEPISVAQIKSEWRTASQTTLTSTTTMSNSSSRAKPSTIPKPVFLHANLASIHKVATAGSSNKINSSSDSEEGETTEQSCTNVLATLAALAEATAPNATISTTEALQWLEMNGITMLPTDNSTVVGSALEGGQTVSLTEAGKLALTWVKEHQNLNNSSAEVSSSVSDSIESSSTTSGSVTSPNQKVITIVADQSHLPSIRSSAQTPIVVLSSQSSVGSTNPPAKKMKSYIGKKVLSKSTTNGTSGQIDSVEDERIKLKNELEKMKRQAEQYKAQLVLKEHEAEQYRRQLEQIKTLPRLNQ